MNKDLEQLVGAQNKDSFRGKTLDVVKQIPTLAVFSAISYSLDNIVGLPTPLLGELSSPESQNLGYHLGVGLGMYGSTCEDYHVKGSLVLLATSLTPDLFNLANDGDLRMAGISSATKLIGYGVGYLTGKLLKYVSDPGD